MSYRHLYQSSKWNILYILYRPKTSYLQHTSFLVSKQTKCNFIITISNFVLQIGKIEPFEIWKALFGSIDKTISEHRSKPLSPYLSALDFLNSPVWNFKFVELIFFPSLNWIFTAWCNLQKSSSNLVFQTGECQKSSADR